MIRAIGVLHAMSLSFLSLIFVYLTTFKSLLERLVVFSSIQSRLWLTGPYIFSEVSEKVTFKGQSDGFSLYLDQVMSD